jgi:hypothetical protein
VCVFPLKATSTRLATRGRGPERPRTDAPKSYALIAAHSVAGGVPVYAMLRPGGRDRRVAYAAGTEMRSQALTESVEAFKAVAAAP